MIRITPATNQVNRPEADKNARRTFIGATDIIRITGIAPASWGGAVQVQREKLGLIEPADLDGVEPVQDGLLFEDAVAQKYQRRYGVSLVKAGRATLEGPDGPVEHVACHPDFIGPDRIVEVKCIGLSVPMTSDRREQWGEEGTDQVPLHYNAQVQYQMECSGIHKAEIAAQIAGRGLVVYDIPYNREIAGYLVDQANRFWVNHILPVIHQGKSADECAPDPTTAEDITLLYPRDNGVEIAASEEHVELIRTLHDLKGARKDLDGQIADIETTIKKALGEASALLYGDQVIATWKASESKRLDTKALRAAHPELADAFSKTTVSRRFLPKKIKGVA